MAGFMSTSATAAASGKLFDLVGATLSDFELTGNQAQVGYRVTLLGTEESFIGPGVSYQPFNTFFLGNLANLNDYEVQFNVVNGDTLDGPDLANVWLPIQGAPAFELTANSPIEIKDTRGLLEIRRIGSTTILATAALNLTAEVVT